MLRTISYPFILMLKVVTRSPPLNTHTGTLWNQVHYFYTQALMLSYFIEDHNIGNLWVPIDFKNLTDCVQKKPLNIYGTRSL